MRINPLHAVLASAVILLSAGLAHRMVPKTLVAQGPQSIDLESMVPRNFRGWSVVPGIKLVDATTEANAFAHKIYSEELARGYRDDGGHVVMLLIAYGPNQDDQLQLHRPELCYPGAGFRIDHFFRTRLSYRTGAPTLEITRLTAYRGDRLEPVSYWMRVGNEIASGVISRRIISLKYGLRGLIPDGVLIRVSTVGIREDIAYKVQDQFIRDLLHSVSPGNLGFFIGDSRDPAGRL